MNPELSARKLEPRCHIKCSALSSGPLGPLRAYGFKGLGFKGLGFKGLGFKGLGFKGLGFKGAGLKAWGFS